MLCKDYKFNLSNSNFDHTNDKNFFTGKEPLLYLIFPFELKQEKEKWWVKA
jgi:hypothetical protein